MHDHGGHGPGPMLTSLKYPMTSNIPTGHGTHDIPWKSQLSHRSLTKFQSRHCHREEIQTLLPPLSADALGSPMRSTGYHWMLLDYQVASWVKTLHHASWTCSCYQMRDGPLADLCLLLQNLYIAANTAAQISIHIIHNIALLYTFIHYRLYILHYTSIVYSYQVVPGTRWGGSFKNRTWRL